MIKFYYYSIIHLHPYQVIFRLFFLFFKIPVFRRGIKPKRLKLSNAKIVVDTSNKFEINEDGYSFDFLNEKKTFKTNDIPWNDGRIPKLWIYQLHYFDYIHKANPEDSFDLIKRWIKQNSDLRYVGWDPYPTSLRIINWIIFLTNNNISDIEVEQSIWKQCNELQKKLEYHLLGNHLWENFRALTVASIYFEDSKNLKKFQSKLIDQFRTQILNDGAQAELTPMYQSIMVNGLCQLIQMYENYSLEVPTEVKTTLNKMSYYLAYLCHPDGKIAQFNDSSIDFSQPPNFIKLIKTKSKLLRDSGHARLENKDTVVIADVGPVAYKYFAGHSHADNLSFELSFKGNRIIVDPGISTYEDGAQRHDERSDTFHNTLKISGMQQSVVWKSFRIGRRAKSYPAYLNSSEASHVLVGGYSYSDLGVRISHNRKLELTERILQISDSVYSSRTVEGYLSFNFMPGLELKWKSDRIIEVFESENLLATISSNVDQMEIAKSFFSPSFGKKIDCQRLLLHFKTIRRFDILTNICFSA